MRLVPARLQMEYNLLAPYTSSRERIVRLIRGVGTPVSGSAIFGFSIRGGREHGTGFFVSEVGGEARAAGLRVGDQILRINGYSVEHAIHKEVLKLIQDSNHLNLKVRSVGMIPVKDRRCDPLTWKPVEQDIGTPPSPSTTPTLDSLDQPELRNMPSEGGIDAHCDMKIFLNIAGRSKLDCCICKGPEWHPGIFIQSTKEGGLARKAGLRPGDQIVECNGINFEDITFSDAVSALKKDGNLNLVIRKGSGTDLFPGESSGYNSSASSINGDGSTSGHSPNGGCQGWNDEGTKRLSIVREEVSDMAATGFLGNTIMQSSEGRVAVDKRKDWDEIEYEWEIADKQQRPVKNEDKEHRVPLPHQFEASEQRLVISEENSIEEVNVEVKTQEVVAMVHRSEVDDTDGTGWEKRETVVRDNHPCIPEAPSISVDSHSTLSKTNSSSSAGSALTSISLSSALSQEIQRRAKRIGNLENGCSDETIKRKNQTKEEGNGLRKDLLKEVADEKRMQHSKLMEEFKKAHSKMFANSLAFEDDKMPPKKPDRETEQRGLDSEKQAESSDRTDKNNVANRTEETSEHIANNESSKPGNKIGSDIPVPPPLPMMHSSENEMANGLPQKERETSAPSPPSTLQKQSSYTRTQSVESSSPRSLKMTFFGSENNIQIIKSQKSPEVNLKNPQIQQPKGPVSVTISEYPSSNGRRTQPTRFDFLSSNKSAGKKLGESTAEVKGNVNNQKDWSNVNSQLQSELLQTLSRSKLKAQTETPLEDGKQSSKTFLAGTDGSNAKGNGTIEIEPAHGKQNSVVSRYLTQMYGPEKPAAEIAQSRHPSSTAFQNTEKILNALSNKVTIRIPNSSVDTANKNGGNP